MKARPLTFLESHDAMMVDPGHTPVAHQRQASVMAVDVVGYTRLMELDELGTHSRLMDFRSSLLKPAVEEWRGEIVKNTLLT